MRVLAHGISVAVAVGAVAYAGHLPMLALPQSVVVGSMWTVFVLGGAAANGRGGERRHWQPAAIGAIGSALCALVVGFPQSPAGWGWLPVFVALAALSATIGSLLPRPAAAARKATAASSVRSGLVAAAVLATTLSLAAEGATATVETASPSETMAPRWWLGGALAPLWGWAGSTYETHGRLWHDGLLALCLLALTLLPAAKHRAFYQPSDESTARLLSWAALALYSIQSALAGSAGWIGSLPGLVDLQAAPALREPLRLMILVSLAWLLTLEQADRSDPSGSSAPGAPYDRGLALVVLGLLLAQSSLGAVQRWWQEGLVYHLVLGTSLVLPAVLHLGFRSWLVDSIPLPHRRSGAAVVALLLIQAVLGGALAVPGLLRALGPASGVLQLSLTVAHLWTGALLVVVATWHAVRQWPPRWAFPRAV